MTEYIGFQFLYGTIRGKQNPCKYCLVENFNSYMVQLEDLVMAQTTVVFDHFNSYMVQLEDPKFKT